MGGTIAIQTQCCLMKRNEHDDEDDVSETERVEEGEKDGAGCLRFALERAS